MFERTGKALILSLGLALAGLAGCSQNLGQMTTQSVTKGDVQIQSMYQDGVYELGDNGLVTVVLIDGPRDNPRQMIIIRTIWSPQAGQTPIEPDATNATIHYAIFAGENGKVAGVYSGAGYVFPHDKVGKPEVEYALWQSNLVLVDSTPGFKDLLGQANMFGKFVVARDDVRAQQYLKFAREHVSGRLGYPRQVLGPTRGGVGGMALAKQEPVSPPAFSMVDLEAQGKRPL